MMGKQHRQTSSRQLELQTDRQWLKSLAQNQSNFNRTVAEKRAQMQQELRQRWRSQMQAKQLKKNIELNEKKYQSVMNQQGVKKYLDVITGLPMNQRAFTPNTTYGDTYRKPGRERKEDKRFMNTDKFLNQAIKEEEMQSNPKDSNYTIKFDPMTPKKGRTPIPSGDEDNDEDDANQNDQNNCDRNANQDEDQAQVIQINEGKVDNQDPFQTLDKQYESKKARLLKRHLKSKHNRGQSLDVKNNKQQMLKKRYEEYQEKLRNLDNNKVGWRTISHTPAQDRDYNPKKDRLNFSIISPGRLGKPRHKITFNKAINKTFSSSGNIIDQIFDTKVLSPLEKDALKRNIEAVQKKADQQKRKAYQQQVQNYKIDLIDGYRQTDLTKRQQHYFQFLKAQAERKKKRQKDQKYKDFMIPHIKGHQGYPRGPHPDPQAIYNRQREVKKQQLGYITKQMRQNEKKRIEQYIEQKEQDISLVKRDNQGKNIMDQLVANKHLSLRQDLINSWNRGAQLLKARREYQKLAQQPRSINHARNQTVELQSNDGLLKNDILSNVSSSIVKNQNTLPHQTFPLKSIRSTHTSTVQKLMQDPGQSKRE